MMIEKTLIALAALIVLSACSGRERPLTGNGETEVAFEVARNYFFKNDRQIPSSPKITTAEEFGRLFGMAATMGENGRPTAIDFDREFVLAIVLPVTDVETEIVPLSVVAKGNTLYYSFQVNRGQEQSFSIQPTSIIILDKKYENMDVSLINTNIQ